MTRPLGCPVPGGVYGSRWGEWLQAGSIAIGGAYSFLWVGLLYIYI